MKVRTGFVSNSSSSSFIIGFDKMDIVVEVGASKNTIKQVVNTMNKIKGTYGIIVSEEQEVLELNKKYNIIKI